MARLLAAAAVVALTALANRAAVAFQVAEGVALVFPASGVTVAAALLLGWSGVAASFLGYVVSAWGVAETVPLRIAFAAAAALQGAVPVAAGLRGEGTTGARIVRFLVLAAGVNVLLSSAVGVPLVAVVTPVAERGRELAMMAVSWTLADAAAVVLLALPVLLLLRPALLLDEAGRELLRRFLRRPRTLAGIAGGIAAVAAAMELLVPTGLVQTHWLATFLLVPVLAAAGMGGAGAALLVAGPAGVVYVVETLRLVRPGNPAELFQVVLTGYSVLAVLLAAAAVAGVYAGRAMALVATLERQRGALQRGFENVVTALAAAIEAKDPSTRGHVQRVARLAVAVGRRLGLEGARLEILRYAAILHDVGKIGVPEAILNKAGELTAAEREAMERHVELGVEILRNVEILAPAVPIIRAHQERWDGAQGGRFPGYLGMRGEEIPLEARIIAVVDAYDAMTNDRPYRRAMSPEAALAELEREAGRQFDPAVVRAVREVLQGAPDGVSDRYPIPLPDAG